ncbi:MAG: response regulator [Alphaproteobacteria bacterium]|nr:response regulator [Alphaproteobacteria bacterium]
MRLSEHIALHLPQLRRFARLLSGSQAAGDAYVAAALESIVGGGTTIPAEGDVRTALYRLLLAIWDSVPANLAAPLPGGPRLAGEHRLEALTPRPRQAFLLRTVEGFSAGEAAAIMGTTPAEFERLTAAATLEIAAEVATSVLIIEDEPLIAIDLQNIMQSLGHAVVGVARTHRDAVAKAKATRPGLVLADIQLADGSSGIDAVNQILGSFSVPIVFVTAYPERLLTGERPEPAYLINKPFHPSVIQAVVSQALFFEQNAKRRAS